jgi:hypothetical protein
MKPLLASLLLLTALRADAQDVKPQSSTTELDSFNKALAWLPQFIASAFDHDNLPGIIRGDQINLHIRSGETQGYVGKRKPPFWFIFHITKDHDSSQSVFSYLARQETAQAPWIIRQTRPAPSLSRHAAPALVQDHRNQFTRQNHTRTHIQSRQLEDQARQHHRHARCA